MDITASGAAEQKRVTIFFCYAREDELLLNQLKNHLQPLQRQGLIKLWYDREIRAGSEWEPEIKKQLDTAQIILLLVSPDFMASDYCYGIEMKHALERHQRGEAIVIPIILRPVYWHGEPLGRLQALPTDGQPVTDSGWHDPDRAFYNVAEGIRKAVEDLIHNDPGGTEQKDLQKKANIPAETGMRTNKPDPRLAFQEPIVLPPINENGLSTRKKRSFSWKAAFWGIFLAGLILMGSVFFIQEGFFRPNQPLRQATTIPKNYLTSTPTSPVALNYDAAIAKNGIQFGFDAQHTRFNPYEQTLTSTTVKNLKKAWTAQTGNMIYSAPAVANGKVYVGSRDGTFYAFNANGCSQLSCRPLWSVDIGPQVDSSPAIVNGKVYFGADDGKLYAFDAGTGKPLWATLANSSGVSWLTIADDIIYVGTGDGMLQAFNAATGHPKWSVPVGTCSCPVHAPAVFNGKVYAGSNDKHLYAFDAGTGKPLWTAPVGDIIDSSLAVANNIVYIGSHNEVLYAFNAGTGKPLWTASINGYDNDTPAVAYNTVYIGSGDGKLYAFNAQTGKPLWTTPTGDSIFSSPMVANNVVYVGSNDKKLYAFDAQTGLMLWFYPTSGEVRSPPAVANGTVYVGSSDGKLYTFHL